MKLQLLAVSAFTIFSFHGFSQTQLKAQTDAGGTGDEVFTQLCLTKDGFLATGTSNSNHSIYKSQNSFGGRDYWVVKYAKDKQTGKAIKQWDLTIGGDTTDILVAARSTRDGGFILAGTSISGESGNKHLPLIGERDTWLVKLNDDGTIGWENEIGNEGGNEDISDMDTTSDGGFILISYEDIIKTDQYGIVQWKKKNIGWYNTIAQTLDKGYILTRWTGIIAKADSAGNILWTNFFDESVSSNFTAQGTKDSGYIMAGIVAYREAGDDYLDFQIIVHKLDKAGNLQWTTKTLQVPHLASSFDISLLKTIDGGYLVGSTGEFGEYFTVKLDSTGTIQWSGTVSGDGYLKDIKEPRPNMYLLGGFSFAGIGGDKTKPNIGGSDYWIVALADTTTNITSVKNIAITNASAQQKNFVVYPNPAKDLIHININAPTIISLIDQQGKIMLTQKIEKENSINVSQLPAGIYFLKDITTGEKQKILINK